MLLSIQGGSDLGLFEINEAARLVQEAAHPEANIIFGAVIDDALGDEVRVTVIAAGFDGGTPAKRPDERGIGSIQGPSKTQQAAAAQQASSNHTSPQRQAPAQPEPAQRVEHTEPQRQAPQAPAVPPVNPSSEPVRQPVEVNHAQRSTETEQRPAPPRTVTFDDGDDLDVPDFLK